MNIINIETFKKILISAANNMSNNKERINSLNVFPVPDGDTGTNMSATLMSGVKNLDNSELNSISSIIFNVSRNMLLGARGNSGVILSQIFKGFADSLEQIQHEITNFDLVRAFRSATTKAYQSVLKPVEGTLLTVIREIAEGLEKSVVSITPIETVLSDALKFARLSCDNTPNLLPVLKEVGVTDSGGEGLICIIEGMLKAVQGNFVEISNSKEKFDNLISNQEIYNGEFGYCTEVIIDLLKPTKFKKDDFVDKVEKKANATSLVVVQDDSILKVHAHVLVPGNFLNICQKYGEFLKIKSENMTEQANESKNYIKDTSYVKKMKSGIISCNTGQGIINIMKENGAHFIIEAGQSSNPSIQDILNAINNVNAEVVFILPNNSNIILAAQQAVQTIKDKKVIVIPTKSQMQGITAIMHFNEETNWEDNKELMDEVIKNVKTIEITKASRTTNINNVKVYEGEFISILNGKVIHSQKSAIKAVIKGIKAAVDDDSEIITIYYGAEASQQDADEIVNYIEENYDVAVEIKSGNQDIYDFFISVE
ncbi:DAK2 domain-containing protein [Mycoplasma iguanae]|uniref:DAK2 domain-containing protein n=1 Tax=Mycoplasma iguanae TaxID=292461 RepID=A0ABY5R8I8_9MOLU|nr:DAK2 domain-containing protein [Mycoplasma iguanae]UVD81626.1 DAK2 domain-containing protein [Mycoplasma iguanae]